MYDLVGWNDNPNGDRYSFCVDNRGYAAVIDLIGCLEDEIPEYKGDLLEDVIDNSGRFIHHAYSWGIAILRALRKRRIYIKEDGEYLYLGEDDKELRLEALIKYKNVRDDEEESYWLRDFALFCCRSGGFRQF